MWSKCKNWGKNWGIIIISILIIVAIAGGSLLIGWGLLFKKSIVKASFISIGIAVVSIGIAFCSIYSSVKSRERLTQLGNESNDKLTTIANAIFMEIVDVFEDKRILLWKHPKRLGLEETIWKCETYVERAYDLHKSTKIDPKNCHRLFEWFNYLINRSGIDFDKGCISYKSIVFEEGKLKEVFKFSRLKENDVRNLLRMVDKFRDFDLSVGDLKQLDRIEKTIEEFKIKSSKK